MLAVALLALLAAQTTVQAKGAGGNGGNGGRKALRRGSCDAIPTRGGSESLCMKSAGMDYHVLGEAPGDAVHVDGTGVFTRRWLVSKGERIILVRRRTWSWSTMDVATLAYFYIYKAVPSYDDQVATEHADGKDMYQWFTVHWRNESLGHVFTHLSEKVNDQNVTVYRWVNATSTVKEWTATAKFGWSMHADVRQGQAPWSTVAYVDEEEGSYLHVRPMTSARRITLNRTAAGGGIDELLVVGLAVVLDQMLSMGMKLYWRCIVPLLLVLAVCCCCGCGCCLLCGRQQRTARDDYKSDYGTFEDADPKRQSASAW